MPSDIYKRIQQLLTEEINERDGAAIEWEHAAGGFAHGDRDRGDCHKSQALAAQNRAECHRLHRLGLEMGNKTTEPVLL